MSCRHARPRHLLVPIGHDRRAVVGLANGTLAGDNLVEVTLHDESWLDCIAGALLSTWTLLVSEITGRSNFGQGLLKTQVSEIAELPVPDPRQLPPLQLAALASAFSAMAGRRAGPIWEDCRLPDRRALDEALLRSIGFEERCQRKARVGDLQQETCAMVRARVGRARRV